MAIRPLVDDSFAVPGVLVTEGFPDTLFEGVAAPGTVLGNAA